MIVRPDEQSEARMPLESTITAAIKRAAEADGWWVMKIHGSQYQLAGVPDLLCLKEGRAAFIEVKQPGKQPSAIQWKRMEELACVGCVPCTVASDVETALYFLGRIVRSTKPTNRPRVESVVDRRPAKAERRGSRCQR